MKRILAVLVTTALMVAMMAMPASAALVNVIDVVDVDVTGNKTVLVAQAPIGVAANLCDTSVAVLAEQIDRGDTECEAKADSQADNSIRGLNQRGSNR